jgi:hypothetical protein
MCFDERIVNVQVYVHLVGWGRSGRRKAFAGKKGKNDSPLSSCLEHMAGATPHNLIKKIFPNQKRMDTL